MCEYCNMYGDGTLWYLNPRNYGRQLYRRRRPGYVPDAILKKAGALSREEWEVMGQHPESGVVILRDKPFYAVARDIAGNHHEKWDGTGYPAGKKGEEIPLAARIVKVADVYDALTTERPYKKAWSEEDALEELRKLSGTAFEPRIVTAFMALQREGVLRPTR